MAALALSLTLCLGVGAFAARFEPGAWYAGLNKPPATPPDATFPIVWTLLYIAMGVAAWQAWRHAGLRRRLHGPFAVQLVLNGAWTALFFGAHLVAFALAELIGLWLAIALTFRRFASTNRIAAALLAPYPVWVGYAGYLNVGIWLLND